MKLNLFREFSCQSLRKSVLVWWLGSAMGLPFLSVTARKIERRSYRRYDPKSHHLSLMIGAAKAGGCITKHYGRRSGRYLRTFVCWKVCAGFKGLGAVVRPQISVHLVRARSGHHVHVNSTDGNRARRTVRHYLEFLKGIMISIKLRVP